MAAATAVVITTTIVWTRAVSRAGSTTWSGSTPASSQLRPAGFAGKDPLNDLNIVADVHRSRSGDVGVERQLPAKAAADVAQYVVVSRQGLGIHDRHRAPAAERVEPD